MVVGPKGKVHEDAPFRRDSDAGDLLGGKGRDSFERDFFRVQREQGGRKGGEERDSRHTDSANVTSMGRQWLLI